ncbi:MAG: fatty acid desaturase [Gammaproteobacteria bacterium]
MIFADLPVWAYILITLALTHITIVAVTVFLHRHQAHRALDLHPLVSHFFRFWLWLTTGMTTKGWVATHRKHHAWVESEEDPHSPRVKGINEVLWRGTELYRLQAYNPETLAQYGHGTPDDWLERNLYHRFSSYGIVLMLAVDLALFGAIGLTIWAVQMIWIPFFAAGVINGLGHWWGYRNFEPADGSTNIIPFGALIGGEELHNNHHAFAGSARFSCRWYEVDLGWYYIRLMQALGLARVRRLAPRPAFDRNKTGVDLDTVRAVVSNRFHVMSHYTRDVVKRVYKEEKTRADSAYRRLLKRSKGLLTRNEALLDERSRQHLETVLAGSPSLQVVYEYSQRLQDLWRQRSLSQEYLLHALQDWCRQAEQTGIKALEDFARSLRAYTLAPAPA